MFATSTAYKNAIKEPVQEFDLKGTIGSIQFNKENILIGSFSISNQCSGENEVQIGSVYIGELSATFINLSLDRYSIIGKEIIPYHPKDVEKFMAEN